MVDFYFVILTENADPNKCSYSGHDGGFDVHRFFNCQVVVGLVKIQ